MSESDIHMKLVEKLADWITESFLNGDSGHVFIEKPDNPLGKRPQIVYGFVPDVMVLNAPDYDCVIGEAKTADDIDNQHTMDQLEAFLRKCHESEDSYFVFAVPWRSVGLARGTIKYCCRNIGVYNVKIKVLDKLPG